ncbi:hypothetical protein MPSEU_000269700 [Mayamaea pseudoterrestris]|nr:hypothetical protein MPSEU_000269700 [Mayamaea pseudoterrestris]
MTTDAVQQRQARKGAVHSHSQRRPRPSSRPSRSTANSLHSQSNLRVILFFLSITWTSYTIWMQRYVDLDYRSTRIALADSLHQFMAEMSFGVRKTAADAVFYDIVVSEATEEHIYASRIVAEQLEQIALSTVQVVYYITQGPVEHELIANTSMIQIMCDRLDLRCYYKGHVTSKAATLQQMYEYCSSLNDEDHAAQIVSYIHSSPRVTNSEIPVNRRLRNILTESALSQECMSALQQPPYEQCNVCGLQFATDHALRFEGDMWTATCAYVRKLVPPNKFHESLQRVVKEVLVQRSRGEVMTNLYPDDRLKLEIEASTMEQWIGSHPDLMPCDLGSSGVDFSNYLSVTYQTEDLVWRQAPRQSAHDMLSGSPNKMVLERTEYRLREYHLLPGHLLKWRGLYSALPGPDSFVWDVFPDGAFWYLTVEKYGLSAIETVVLARSIALSKKTHQIKRY